MRNENSIIKTHLNRSIALYIVAVIVVFLLYILYDTIGMLVMIVLILILFLQFVLSKEIFKIILSDTYVTFEYLRFVKKTARFRKDEIIGKKRVEVKFRGGKNEILELYSKKLDKKLFEMNKKLFDDTNDFDFLEHYFSDQ